MSELKATTAQEIVRKEKDCDYMDELFGGVKMPPTQVYLKSEADNVIAHNKHRRCLAMAQRWLFAFYATNKCNDKFYLRSLKYRELAEKFKTKSTAL